MGVKKKLVEINVLEQFVDFITKSLLDIYIIVDRSNVNKYCRKNSYNN